MALVRVVLHPRRRIPQLSRLVKAARHNLVPIRIVECDGVHHVFMSLQSQQLAASGSVPHLARPVVAACDELIASLVEGAVGEGEYVGPQHLEQIVHARVGLHLQTKRCRGINCNTSIGTPMQSEPHRTKTQAGMLLLECLWYVT